jgi:ABC-type multidrug transport system fused ATPase/permease subunit
MAKRDLPKAKMNLANLRKAFSVFGFVSPGNKILFILGLIFLSGTAITSILFPKFTGDLINAKSLSIDEINAAGVIFIYLFLAQAVFSFLRVVLFVKVTEDMVYNLRTKLYERVISKPLEFFTENRIGDINSRFGADLGQIQDAFTTNVAFFIRQLLIIILGIGAIFWTSFELAKLMLITIPVVMIVAVVFGRFIRKISKNVQDITAETNTIVEETVQGIMSVKSFANEAYELMRFGTSSDAVKKLGVKRGILRGAFSSFIIICLFGAIVLLIWKAMQMVNQGLMTDGEAIQFLMYTLFVGGSIGGIAEQYLQIQKGIGSIDRVLDIIGEDVEDVEVEDRPIEKKLNGTFAFKNVDFTYPARKEMQILHDLSFEVNEGEKIALVGSSGAGKSTVASLLLKFYDVDSGEVRFNGDSIDDIPLYDLRKQIAFVPQEVLLFGGTIYENILYGDVKASEEDVKKAAQMANAAQFIESFPEGYETVVGDRGIKLSGGQRQRIAIARAMLKNPKILILDEATSSLDSESEQLVQMALENLMEGRTALIIAHRLGTIKNCDSILVLSEGKVVERGTYQELIDKDGMFSRLHDLQTNLQSQ